MKKKSFTYKIFIGILSLSLMIIPVTPYVSLAEDSTEAESASVSDTFGITPITEAWSADVGSTVGIKPITEGKTLGLGDTVDTVRVKPVTEVKAAGASGSTWKKSTIIGIIASIVIVGIAMSIKNDSAYDSPYRYDPNDDWPKSGVN